MPTMCAGLLSSRPAAARHSWSSMTRVMVSASASLAWRSSMTPPMITESQKATPDLCSASLFAGSPSTNSNFVEPIFSPGKSYRMQRLVLWMNETLIDGAGRLPSRHLPYPEPKFWTCQQGSPYRLYEWQG